MCRDDELCNELLKKLMGTGAVRSPELKLDEPPKWYRAYMDKVTIEKYEVPCETAGESAVCYVLVAKDKIKNCPVFINIHGGGYVYPTNEKDTMYCAHVAAEIHGIVVNVEYVTTDRAPFPAAFEQCYEAAKWTFANCVTWGADPARVSIGGQSAGGCLTVAINMRAAKMQDLGGKFRMQILNYPILDNYDAINHPEKERIYIFSMLYAGGYPEVLKAPYASPIFAEDEMLKNQPHTLMLYAGKCFGRKNAEDFAIRLVRAGNDVTMHSFTESRHGYLCLLTDEWKDAQDYIINSLNNC